MHEDHIDGLGRPALVHGRHREHSVAHVAIEPHPASRTTRAGPGLGGAHPDGSRCLRRPVAREELDELVAHPGQVGAEADKRLGADALALADQAEEHVLSTDVVVAKL